jgi:hypothetical protein
MDFSSAFHLEKLLPASLGISIPFTFNYTSSSVDPLFVTQSDIEADAIHGLRTPKSAATSMTLSLRRTKQSTGSAWSPILNNLALNSSYTTGVSRSEYEDGNAKNFVVGLDFNLVARAASRHCEMVADGVHLTTTYQWTRRSRLVPQARVRPRRHGAPRQRHNPNLEQWQQSRVPSLQGGIGSLGHHVGA